MRGDHVKHAGKDRRIDPEHHDAKTDHADGAVKELAVKAQLALVDNRDQEGRQKRDPDRRKLRRKRADDADSAQWGEHASNDIDDDQGQERQQCIAHSHANHRVWPAISNDCAICENTVVDRRQGIGADHLNGDEDQKDHQHHREDRINEGSERACPG